jgi:hypothetical protein
MRAIRRSGTGRFSHSQRYTAHQGTKAAYGAMNVKNGARVVAQMPV